MNSDGLTGTGPWRLVRLLRARIEMPVSGLMRTGRGWPTGSPSSWRWRAITSLEQSRALAWQLHAAALGVDYPVFGAVSVQNAELPAPEGLGSTLVAVPTHKDVLRAARELADVLIG